MISAGTVGILAEIYLHGYLVGRLRKDIREQARESTSEHIALGLGVWLRRENFQDKFGFGTEFVASLYEQLLIKPFGEPVIDAYKLTIKYLGQEKFLLAQNQTFERILLDTQYTAFNTAKPEHGDVRFINRNGVVLRTIADLFVDSIPPDSKDRADLMTNFMKDLAFETNKGDGICKPHKIIPCQADYLKHLRGIREKKRDEIVELVRDITGSYDEDCAYLLYGFHGKPISDETTKLSYVLFYGGKIKCGEKLNVHVTRSHLYWDTHYHYMFLQSLTRGLLVRAVGFENDFVTVFDRHLTAEPVEVAQTSDTLSVPALILPGSYFHFSWKKRNHDKVMTPPA
jgi:hypothetical protein